MSGKKKIKATKTVGKRNEKSSILFSLILEGTATFKWQNFQQLYNSKMYQRTWEWKLCVLYLFQMKLSKWMTKKKLWDYFFTSLYNGSKKTSKEQNE